MRHRYVINKGIGKKILAISRYFIEDATYTAVIYNPKDLSTKIMTEGVCYVEGEHNKVQFIFSAESTDELKVGVANIEIYDADKTLMIYRDNFALIRKNSLQIDDDDNEPIDSES